MTADYKKMSTATLWAKYRKQQKYKNDITQQHIEIWRCVVG